jgi:hypothetical protein
MPGLERLEERVEATVPFGGSLRRRNECGWSRLHRFVSVR